MERLEPKRQNNAQEQKELDRIQELYDASFAKVRAQIDAMESPFHNWEHTETVVRRVEIIMDIFKKHGLVNDRDTLLAKLAALHHDVVFKSESVTLKASKAHHLPRLKKRLPEGHSVDFDVTLSERKKYLGINEAESIEFLDGELEEIRKTSGVEILTYADMVQLIEGVLATTPTFHGSKVSQLGFDNGASPFEVALMLADLGTAGMNEEPEVLKKETRGNFWEKYTGLKKKLDANAEFTDSEKIYYVNAIKRYLRGQADFVANLKSQYNENKSVIPAVAQADIDTLFSHYDENAKFAADDYGEIKNEDDFDVLTQHMSLAA